MELVVKRWWEILTLDGLSEEGIKRIFRTGGELTWLKGIGNHCFLWIRADIQLQSHKTRRIVDFGKNDLFIYILNKRIWLKVTD